jgi:hypothetical protein
MNITFDTNIIRIKDLFVFLDPMLRDLRTKDFPGVVYYV